MTLSLVAEPIESIPLKTGRDSAILVGNTRVPLDTVIGAFTDGATPEEVVYQYPTLELADVYAVLGYYLNHRSEVDDYLNRRRQQAQKVRGENEERFVPVGVRERLLARRR